MIFKHKNVLVYGLGDSGRAAIKILIEIGAKVSFFDDDINFLTNIGFEKDPFSKKYDYAIISPGVKVIENKLINHLKDVGTIILSELDLAYMLCKGKIVAITGTNGKTTTCMLVHKMLKTAGFDAVLCGNIGLPFSSVVQKVKKDTIVVCEVSSFQLETSQLFRPNIACILNIQPDHIDRHETFENYKNAKEKIAQKMKKKDVLILNSDDENAKNTKIHNRLQFFSKNPLKKGVFVLDGGVFVNRKRVLDLENIKLRGEKNLENVLAAIAICSHFHIEKDVFKGVLENFAPAHHRMEVLGVVDGVTYVDDSKATNVASTIACVEAFKDEKLILLMGGKSKKIDYGMLFSQKFDIKSVICFGEEGIEIAKCAGEFGCKTEVFEWFERAVRRSVEIAEKGDFVLLSPACSSFDEFASYVERGEKFCELILGTRNEKC